MPATMQTRQHPRGPAGAGGRLLLGSGGQVALAHQQESTPMRFSGLAASLALALFAAPLAAEAQPRDKVARLGVLLLSAADPNLDAFRQGLRGLGHVEGQNLAIEYRDAAGNAGRLAEVAAELVRLKPDVILALGGDVAPLAKQATRTIPIVMVTSADPVRGGLVASLARPGGT